MISLSEILPKNKEICKYVAYLRKKYFLEEEQILELCLAINDEWGILSSLLAKKGTNRRLLMIKLRSYLDLDSYHWNAEDREEHRRIIREEIKAGKYPELSSK